MSDEEDDDDMGDGDEVSAPGLLTAWGGGWGREQRADTYQIGVGVGGETKEQTHVQSLCDHMRSARHARFPPRCGLTDVVHD